RDPERTPAAVADLDVHGPARVALTRVYTVAADAGLVDLDVVEDGLRLVLHAEAAVVGVAEAVDPHLRALHEQVGFAAHERRRERDVRHRFGELAERPIGAAARASTGIRAAELGIHAAPLPVHGVA